MNAMTLCSSTYASIALRNSWETAAQQTRRFPQHVAATYAGIELARDIVSNGWIVTDQSSQLVDISQQNVMIAVV